MEQDKLSYSELWVLLLNNILSPSNTFTSHNDSLAGAKRVVEHSGWTWEEWEAAKKENNNGN